MATFFRPTVRALCMLLLFCTQIPATATAGSPEGEKLWDQGQAAYQENRFEAAIGYYQRALEAFRRAGDLDGAGTTCYNLALAYEGIDDFRKALASYEASLEFYRKLNSPPDMAVNMLNIGVLEYRTFRRYDAALVHLQDALKVFMDMNEEEFAALARLSPGIGQSLYRKIPRSDRAYMTTYYGYLKDGRSRADALAQARRDMKAKYPNPFYWAVFILHGDG